MTSLDEADSPPLRGELEELLRVAGGRLGMVYRLIADGVTDPAAIVEAGGAANAGAVSNEKAKIAALLDDTLPTSPSVAAQVAGAVRALRRRHGTTMGVAVRDHLDALADRLDEVVADRGAQEREDAELKAGSDVLEDALAVTGGVYVYTLPHYLRYPFVEGTARTLLKVGMTTGLATSRVRDQARLTSLPEDPVLLRVYRLQGREPAELERVFHRLLEAADHDRSTSRTGGTEWFATSLEFLDVIAETLHMETVRPSG